MPRPIEGDSRRQAVPAIRGYFYQVWWSLHAWVTLREGEALYLEGAEDFDTASAEVGTATQVKQTAQPLSLGSQEARQALDHYLMIKEKNSGRTIGYRFLTTARSGYERGKTFGKEVAGLDFWRNCQRSGKGAEVLQQYLLGLEGITARLRHFLESREPDEVLRELIQPFVWETTASSREGIEKLVLEQLVYRGEARGVSPSEAEKTVNRLLRETLEAATKAERRQLTKADYYSIFEDETSVRVPRAEAQINSVARVAFERWPPNVLGQVLANWAQRTSPPSFETVSKREAAVTDLASVLRQDGLLVITGTTGMGKTTLAKQLVDPAKSLHWLPLRSIPAESRSHFCRSLSLSAPSALESGSIVVLDDLQREWFVSMVYDEFAQALIVLRELNVLVIITSTVPFPDQLLRRLGLTRNCHRPAAPFSRTEIENFAQRMGCTRLAAQEWGGVVEMQTRGHPQLVHAALLTQV